MKIYCPHTIGSANPRICDHGNINGIRCPHWQLDGQYVHVENLMDNPMVMESALCQYIPEIIRDFEVVGNYRWHCTQWPGIHEKGYVCMLQDGVGNRFTMDEVIRRYAHDVIESNNTPVVIPTDDGERETQGYAMYN